MITLHGTTGMPNAPTPDLGEDRMIRVLTLD